MGVKRTQGLSGEFVARHGYVGVGDEHAPLTARGGTNSVSEVSARRRCHGPGMEERHEETVRLTGRVEQRSTVFGVGCQSIHVRLVRSPIRAFSCEAARVWERCDVPAAH